MAVTARDQHASACKNRLLVCPLCGSERLAVLQRIASKDIAGLYSEPLSGIVTEQFERTPYINYTKCIACDLRFFDPQHCASAAFYDALKIADGYYQLEKPEFAFARSLISSRHEVLEIGCGDGAFAKSIAPLSYTGLETTPSSAVAARKAGFQVEERDVREYARTSNKKFDVVCGFQVLEHVSDPGLFLRACSELLRGGGRLVLSVPSASSFASNLPNHALDLPPHHVSRWTDRCLAGLSSLLSLEVEEIWHEPLRELHRRMYVHSRLWGAFAKLVHREDEVVHTSVLSRAVLWFGWKSSKVLAPFGGARSARGISVTIVLRKPA